MKSFFKLLILPLIFVGYSATNLADTVQSGVYLSGESLASDKAAKEGLGTQLKTFGVDLQRSSQFNPSFDKYFSLGVGLTGGDDKESFNQNVQQGSGGTSFSEKSSIFGATAFADIGLGRQIDDKVKAYAGLGSSYYYLRREISDCAGCKVEKIDLSLAPYARLGINFCGESRCVDIGYRYFLSEDYAHGISISVRSPRRSKR